MNLKTLVLALAAAGGLATGAHADQACLIEGKAMNEVTKDCSQTSAPVSAAEYAAQCKESGSIFAAMGGAGGATVVKACPPAAQGACVNPFGAPVTTYYYSRTPQLLADTKTSCLAQKGKWVAKP